jgi:hypothetical protein
MGPIINDDRRWERLFSLGSDHVGPVLPRVARSAGANGF